jgi:hypothetical protein
MEQCSWHDAQDLARLLLVENGIKKAAEPTL